MATIEISYTETFEKLLDLIIKYLVPFSSETQVITRILAVINSFEQLVLASPYAAPISPSMLSLGVKNYREYNAKDGQSDTSTTLSRWGLDLMPKNV